jgi:FlaA1/EpsC-like NDP-sugar epimerase
LIFVSTDKAADPASVMGASKRIGEVILLALRKSETKMKAVRLGNVLSSSGSIVPLFSEQISSGKPVTVTHPEVRRYFMTVEETVAALLEAASAHIHDGIWVPVLGEPVRITELAKYMFSVMRPEANAKMEMIVTDLRPGDKLEEVLVSRHESWAEASNENALLRPVNSPLHIVNLEAAIDTLRHAVHDRDLAQLMRGISQLVPEYEPWPNSSFHDSTATSGVIG